MMPEKQESMGHGNRRTIKFRNHHTTYKCSDPAALSKTVSVHDMLLVWKEVEGSSIPFQNDSRS